jgi:subtilisin
MRPPWQTAGSWEQFPGVPAWGAPTSRHSPDVFPVTALDRITPEWAWAGADGEGVRVCVIDSGLDGRHPLIGDVDQAMTVEFTGGAVTVAATDPVDTAGHGTACAGIIRALAPKVSLSSMQVLTDALGGKGQALLAGLDWAISEAFDVINLSLATTKPELSTALYELAAHNMPVRSFPWPFASVISVACHDQDEPLLHYYNPVPPVEFHARGVGVPVAWPGGGQVRVTGNSFAAPHIAGLCALILSKHPWLTPFQLKSVLYQTARNVRDIPGGNHADA